MQVLEKILEEIKEAAIQEDAPIYLGDTEVDRYVQESVVKEIIRSHMDDAKDTNDDWIPVEEELPEEDGFYIATIDGEICGQEKPFSGLAEFENRKWIDDEEDYKCILAWQPLPEPYKPKESISAAENIL